MEVRVLGPLAVILGNGQPLELGGRRGPLLAYLALAAGPVRRADLIPLVAEDEPTPHTERLLDFHLDALRRSLGAHRLRLDGDITQLDLHQGELDAADFEREVTAGLEALSDDDFATGAALLQSTLSRWRGEVLEGFPAPWAAERRHQLNELRTLGEAALATTPDIERGQPVEAGSVQTFLMTDVVGSTKLWEEQPGPMALALERHDELVADAVRRSGGRFLKHRGEGDSTFSVFGSPTDAVISAVAMQRALGAVVWPDGLQIAVRASVYTGEAIERDGDYYGPTVNRAARLRSLARGGQVLLSSTTAQLVGDQLPGQTRLVTQGLQALRGVSRPEEVYAIHDLRVPAVEPPPVVGAAPAPSDTTWLELPRPLAGASTAFTGRSAELRRMMQILDAARTAQRVVFIGGDPGIGKTRLTAELARRARDQEAFVLFGREEPDHVIPYRAFVRAFDTLVNAAPSELLERYAEEYGADLVRLVPAFNRRLPWLEASRPSDPAVERHGLFEAIRGMLAHLTALGPVVLMIDDAHDASDDTIALLRYLIEAADDLPLLITATYRDSEVDPSSDLGDLLTAARRAPHQELLTLDGLTADDLSVLASDVLGADRSDVADLLAAETGGNPLFAIELLRGGALVDPATVSVGAPPRIPETVRDVLMRRVDRLGPETAKTMVMAAVAGNEFDLSVVAKSLDANEERVLADVEQALDAHLVAESSEPGRFVFAHGLIAHTLQASLTQTRLARAHLAVADAIETVWGTDSVALVEEIASHLVAAGPVAPAERVLAACRRAGDRALAQLAPEQAILWYERVVDLSHDQLLRCDALVALGEAQRQAGLPDFRETLLGAAHTAEAAGDRDRLLAAAVTNHRGDRSRTYFVDAERVRVLRAAIDAAGSEPSPLRARALALLALETAHDPDWRARLAVSDESLAEARILGDLETLCEVLRLRFEAIRLPDTLQTRTVETAEYISAAESLGDPLHVTFAHVYRSRVCLESGDIDGLDRHFARADELGQRLREPFLRWNLSAHHVFRAMMRGHIAESEAAAYRCAEIAKQSGQPDAGAVLGDHLLTIRDAQGRASEQEVYLRRGLEQLPGSSALRCTLAYIVSDSGRVDEAIDHIDQLDSDDGVDVLRDLTWMATMSYLARAIVNSKHVSAARVVYEELHPWGDQVVWSGASSHGPMHLYLGPLAALLGERDVALDHARRALETSRSMSAPLWLATSLTTIAELTDGDEARRAADEAGEIAARHGFGRIARQLGDIDQTRLPTGGSR